MLRMQHDNGEHETDDATKPRSPTKRPGDRWSVHPRSPPAEKAGTPPRRAKLGAWKLNHVQVSDKEKAQAP